MQEENIHIDVALMAFYDNNLSLLMKKQVNSTYGDNYAFFGGRVNFGETPRQAVQRNLLEELGIIPDCPKYFWNHSTKPNNNTINEYMFIMPLPGLDIIKSDGAKLISIDALLGFNLIPGHDYHVKQLRYILSRILE